MTRLIWLSFFCAILFIFLAALFKIFTLQVGASDTNIENKNDKYYERGAIFDRNSNILAMQVKSWNVGLRLIDTQNSQKPISKLAKILDLPYENLRKTLSENPNRYKLIKRLISKEEHDAIKNLQSTGDLVGVQMQEIKWRKYPGKDSMAHVIGYYGVHGKGLDGIEKTYDSYLQADPKRGIGNSVYLTIDSILQKSIEEIVKETFVESKSSHITTILMNAKTGEVLSFVSIPSFDLNSYYSYDPSQLSNKIIQYIYEPGSVFKIFTIASVLDANLINAYTTFNTSGPYVDPRYGFVINDLYYHGIISTSQILKFSSNVGTSLAVSRMDSNLYFRYLRSFGFGDETNITLAGESSGILHNPSQWSARSKQTIGLGQEIGITAMQMTAASTVFTNKGVLLQPLLVKKIVSPQGKTIFSAKRTALHQVIKPAVAQQVLNMMKTATEPGGTAHRMRFDGISISAKTGTAQVFDVEKKQYSTEKFIASTLAIMPTEDPQLIIYAAIHNPTSGETYGGRTTAPMIRKMLDFILPYMGIVGSELRTIKIDNPIEVPPKRIQAVKRYATYENYTGMSKREIWTLFAQKSTQLSFKGSGHVVGQNPAPGAKREKNEVLTLFFE